MVSSEGFPENGKASGDYITITDFDQYENILVLHSYHYNWSTDAPYWQKVLRGKDPTKEYRPKETYARKVGLELEKLNLPNLIVIESQKNRQMSNLLRKYKSKWLLDLHDCARNYNPKTDKDNSGNRIISILEVYPNYKNEKIPQLGNKLYDFLDKKYQQRKMRVGIINSPIENYNSRLIGVELMPWFSIKEGVKFIKTLSQYLKTI